MCAQCPCILVLYMQSFPIMYCFIYKLVPGGQVRASPAGGDGVCGGDGEGAAAVRGTATLVRTTAATVDLD